MFYIGGTQWKQQYVKYISLENPRVYLFWQNVHVCEWKGLLVQEACVEEAALTRRL